MRVWLTTGPGGLSVLPRTGGRVLLLIALSCFAAGCVGGQSGTEGLCPEGMVQRNAGLDGSMNDAFGTLGSDEDGGVEMEPDADATLIATEGHDVPNQCIVPED